ncbi:MAG: hypothetical protein H7Y03_05555 [Chitinophagaceae bacterium]|nr:hypothetical protein [Chitinophagaceae bacterium]
MSVLKQIAEYLYIRKKDPNAPRGSFINTMHGINRLSIFMFIIAIIIIIVKLIIRKQ